MINLDNVKHHPVITELVDVLCNKTQNTDRGFFATEVAYFIGKIASMMRASVVTKDRGAIPINIYALALANSGYGKGHSMAILEEELLSEFRARFMNETFPLIAEDNLLRIATKNSAQNGTAQGEEHEKISKEFRVLGTYPFTFDSGTVPAVKQLRQKLLLANCGAINLQIDEIGSNLIGATDVLTLFLELYDQGRIKEKLTKNTVDNTRSVERYGKTPTNMLLFGTPSKLFDGGQTEDHFYSFLETGYARRCLFGMGHSSKRTGEELTPESIYQELVSPANSDQITKWADQFERLADPMLLDFEIEMPEDVSVELIRYRLACERFSEKLPEHSEIIRAEINHRYFKALKLAGAYAFIDQSQTLTMEHLHSAILFVEESGKAFTQILSREKAYVKLAKYIADNDTEVTHADLLEALPFYTRGTAARNELMTLATAWGYKRHIIIKKSYVDGIEFFKGEKLEETNLDELVLSYSSDWAYNYLNQTASFDQLHKLTQHESLHWVNHHLQHGHRHDDNAIQGFNMLVVDVDGGVPLSVVHELFKDYKYLTYTTKSHTPENNRFRLILPTNYKLYLDQDEYKEFVNAFLEWLPFKSDTQANQRVKKWQTFNGDYHYNHEGALLDILDFIPKTSRNESYKKQIQDLGSLDNLERWFAGRIAAGNRNNHMLRYAMILMDGGMSYIDIETAVMAFNKRLNDPLTADELQATVLKTVAKKISQPVN